MSNRPLVYDAYNTPPKVGTDFTDDLGKTDASHAPDCDMNRIMARYAQTGIVPPSKVAAQFLDVSSIGDYKEAMDFIINANDSFMRLDARIREYFDNDAGLFLQALEDPTQREALQRLGVLQATPPASGGVPKPESGSGPAVSQPAETAGAAPGQGKPGNPKDSK